MKKTLAILSLVSIIHASPIWSFKTSVAPGESYFLARYKNNEPLIAITSITLDENSLFSININIQNDEPKWNENIFSTHIKTDLYNLDSPYRVLEKSTKNEVLSLHKTIQLFSKKQELNKFKSEKLKINHEDNITTWSQPIFKNNQDYQYIFIKGKMEHINQYLIIKKMKRNSLSQPFMTIIALEPDEYMKQRKAFKEKQAKEQQQAEQLQRQKDEEALKHEE